MATQADANPIELRGARVVLVGQFLATPRSTLARALRGLGARVDRQILAETDLVIVGLRTWAIRRSGRISRTLMVARLLQMRQPRLQILSETEFDRRSGRLLPRAEASDAAPSTVDASDESSELRAMAVRIDEWQRAKLLADWLTAGISPRRVERALQELGRWIPEARTAWERLRPRWDGRRLVLQLPNGALCDASGQLLFADTSIAPDPSSATIALPAGEPFAAAVRAESQGDFVTAEACYRRSLLEDGFDVQVSFNLANVLVERGQRRAALERLWQCVEHAPAFVEAWYNLGLVALELHEIAVARQALSRAVDLAPNFTAAGRALAAAVALEQSRSV